MRPDPLDFVIVCYGRSGSHMLADALAGHEQVGRCWDKHARHARDAPRFDAGAFEQPDVARRFGCAVHYSAWHYYRRVADLSRVRFVHLTRDVRDVSLSVLRYKAMKAAGANREAYALGDEVPRGWNKTFSEAALARQMTHVLRLRRSFDAAIPRPRMEVTYEELTRGENVAEVRHDDLLRFLDLWPCALPTGITRGVSRYDS